MASPIVVGVDTTADSLAALNTAAEMAQSVAAPIVAVHVRHEPSLASSPTVYAGDAALEAALDEVEATTRERVSDVMAGRMQRWRFEVAAGDPGSELINKAMEHQAAAIVVGGRSHGVVAGVIVGSVAQKLVRKSPVSVLVVRDGTAHRVTDHDAGAAPAQPLGSA